MTGQVLVVAGSTGAALYPVLVKMAANRSTTELMPEIVTAVELANELGVDPKKLRRWLRAAHENDHGLLAGHVQFARWEFSRADADRLAADFAAADESGHVSDSAVQRRAEEVIRSLLAARLGVDLAPATIKLAAGAPVQVDAASADRRILAEIFARQGALKGGQQKKVAIDTLKLITIRQERPDTTLVIAFADPAAAAYATGRGWLAQALRTWHVDVEILDIPQHLREEILAAQAGQKMVNIEDVADDIAEDTD